MTSIFGLDAVHTDYYGASHPDEHCTPCTRPTCNHFECQHVDDPRARNGAGGCDQPGCACSTFLVDDDCPGEKEISGVVYDCNARGYMTVENPRTGEDYEVTCSWCHGTGHAPVEVAS